MVYAVTEGQANVVDVNREAVIFEVGACTGEGVDEWCDWLLGHSGTGLR